MWAPFSRSDRTVDDVPPSEVVSHPIFKTVRHGFLSYLANEIAHNANVRTGCTGVRVEIDVDASELKDGGTGKEQPGVHKESQYNCTGMISNCSLEGVDLHVPGAGRRLTPVDIGEVAPSRYLSIPLYCVMPQSMPLSKTHNRPVGPTEKMEYEARSHERCENASDASWERLVDAEAAPRPGAETGVRARPKASQQTRRHRGSARRMGPAGGTQSAISVYRGDRVGQAPFALCSQRPCQCHGVSWQPTCGGWTGLGRCGDQTVSKA